MIVVDASLATKWFLDEVDSEQSRRFLNAQRGQLCGPDVLAIEVSRALVAAVNARRVDALAMRSAIHVWLQKVSLAALTLHPLQTRLIQHGVDVALQLGHPLTDCLYLALAIDLDCDLATCDAKFQARAAPLHPRVKLLSDFN